MSTKDVAINRADLSAVKSFSDAVELATQAYGDLLSTEELGDGFTLVKDKDKLVGLEFLVLQWQWVLNGEHGEYVILRCIDRSNNKFVFVDGGSGIKTQLLQFEQEHDDQAGGLMAPWGLRRSDYDYTDDKGVERPATTFYLAESGTVK